MPVLGGHLTVVHTVAIMRSIGLGYDGNRPRKHEPGRIGHMYEGPYYPSPIRCEALCYDPAFLSEKSCLME